MNMSSDFESLVKIKIKYNFTEKKKAKYFIVCRHILVFD
jgi:hypothetical protein